MTARVAGVYQPLAWLVFEMEYVLFGISPRGYHAVSIVLHSANAVLAYFLIRLILRRAAKEAAPVNEYLHAGAFLGALFFAVHPLRTEVVSWLSCQPYLLCSVFYFTGLCFYCRHCEEISPSRKWLAATFAVFFLALLSKAAAVSFPIALVLLDAYPFMRTRGDSRRSLEKVPFFLLSFVFVVAAVAVRDVAPLSGPSHLGFAARLLQSSYAILFFLAKTVLPVGLTGFYPIPPEADLFGSWLFVASAIGTVAAFAVLFAFRKRIFPVWLAWLFYTAALLPNLGIITFSTSVLTADRYSYISCFAWFVLLAYAMTQLLQKTANRRSKAVLIAGVFVVVVSFSATTWRQQQVWNNSLGFWTHAWSHGGQDDFMVNEAMGKVLCATGKCDEGLPYYEHALASHPTLEQELAVLNAIAVVFRSRGQLDRSLQWLLKALAIGAGNSYTRNSLGVTLDKMGFFDEAAKQFQLALKLDPNNEDAKANLENSVKWRASLDADIAHFSEEVKKHPADAGPRNQLGALLGTRGRLDEALARFREALRLDPENVTAERNLASGIELQKKRNSSRRFSEPGPAVAKLPRVGVSASQRQEKSSSLVTIKHLLKHVPYQIFRA